MPVGQMCQVIKEGLEQKLLWGTDMCIPKHFFPEVNLVDYYCSKLACFFDACTQSQFDKVTCENSQKLFHIVAE